MTYEVGSVHNAVLNGVCAVNAELQVEFLALVALAFDLLDFQLLWSLLLGLDGRLQGSSLLFDGLFRSRSGRWLFGSIRSWFLLSWLLLGWFLFSGLLSGDLLLGTLKAR